MHLTPKNLHKLRILSKDLKSNEKIKISMLDEELVSLGEELGLWLRSSNNSLLLMEDGESLALAPHWRLWSPNQTTIDLLGENTSRRYFIDAKVLSARPKVVDLFCGVGGLSSGFHSAGFDVVLALDNDKEACEAHAKNFPETKVVQADINSVVADMESFFSTNIGTSRVNGVIGGPPCQGFSYMGERNHGDERNLLTSRYMDVVLHLKPDFFVMENVPGLATSGLPPKFASYVKKLGKSIGEYASNIVDALPEVPKSVAKRDRQFRKKLVSGVVTAFIGYLEYELSNQEASAIEISKSMDSYHAAFVDMLSTAIASSYDNLDVGAFVSQCDDNINVIVFSNVLDILTKGKKVSEKKLKDSDCEDFLKEISMHLPDDARLKRTIDRIVSDYDNAPQGGVFKGAKVGPILLNLINRASSEYEIAKPEVLNSAHYGTPQNRQRMFIVGIRKGLDINYSYPEPDHMVDGMKMAPTTREAIGDLPDIDDYEMLIDGHELPAKEYLTPSSTYQNYMRLEDIAEGDLSLPRESWNPDVIDCCNRTIHAEHVVERLKTLEPGKQEATSHKPRLHPDRQSPTLRAGTRENKGSHTAVRPVHYEHLRVVSVREGARLMGYPDWMTFHKTKWHGFRLVGNGVPYHLSRSVAKSLKNQLYK
ncbi:hypothetical protein CGK38_23155 [Vibrio parahaemolyticus]|nr:hypothetical protein CGK38_23155 [Vibrio parahaemolyticus]